MEQMFKQNLTIGSYVDLKCLDKKKLSPEDKVYILIHFQFLNNLFILFTEVNCDISEMGESKFHVYIILPVRARH